MTAIKAEKCLKSQSSFNSVKFDLENDHDQYLLYCQFLAWYCKGSSIAPLTDYANNKVYQELLDLEKYLTKFDGKIFIDLRRGKTYTGGNEKLTRDDSALSVTKTLKVH